MGNRIGTAVIRCAMTAAVLAAGAARATLTDKDLLVANDRLITCDSVAGLEWLDLLPTSGQSYDAVAAGYGGYITTYGFSFATTTQVDDLYENAGLPNHSGSPNAGNVAPIQRLFGLMDCTNNCSSNFPYSIGYADLPVFSATHAGAGVLELDLEGPSITGTADVIDTPAYAKNSSQIDAASYLVRAHPELAAAAIDWVGVGNAGNACDSQAEGCFGSVAYGYQISKYEVTNAQYAEFLNAVAATDTNGLYNTNMGSHATGGITQTCAGPCTYNAIDCRENRPVNFVSFYDAARFANWLYNGQPTGAQDASTTEDGAYTLNGANPPGVVRNAGMGIFLPTEDEWYKAAYYSPGGLYFDYPAESDTETTCSTPTATANSANCNFIVNDVRDIGSYTGSASPYDTFDQGGNVSEWNEAISLSIGCFNCRGMRGAAFSGSAIDLAASNRGFADPANEAGRFGFRVVPEPGRNLLLVAGVLSLLGLAGWRRGRA
jgi:formylglycine-generating enzyme required for sulfatase activity